MKQLEQILRARARGVRFDYYMMDAFWYAQDGGYRVWRKEGWPNGPDRWIDACLANGIKPGLWFSTNTLFAGMVPVPTWRDSLAADKASMSFYEGGFLPDLMNTLEYWYKRGIRIFKFDFADFAAATPGANASQTAGEIRQRNERAFRDALFAFRTKHPDAVTVAFNGFGGDQGTTLGNWPFHSPVDLGWLDVFDALYTGDPRPSDVPEMSFWRSLDIYTDHMVRLYGLSGVPLARLDNTGFMLGNTGTIYARGARAWQGALLLMLARGGWVSTTHGRLDLLTDEQLDWYAKVEAMFAALKERAPTTAFGGIPGRVEPYGFAAGTADGGLYVVVNPAQSVQALEVPFTARGSKARILFQDAGNTAILDGHSIRMGPGQLALVGDGSYADKSYDLGTQNDVVIPIAIEPVSAHFETIAPNVIEATIVAPDGGDLRITMQQLDPAGAAQRSFKGSLPDGMNMARWFVITARQDGKDVPVTLAHDKVIWSGLSWGAGEISHAVLRPGQPVTIRIASGEPAPVLIGRIYRVAY